jgi:phosphomannomutase
MTVLDEIVKAYDVRGTVPDQLNETVARSLGVAFARYAGASELLIGRDMRPTGPALVAAFTDGVRSQGVDVVDIGLASSDMVYFASGHLDCPGAIFTASHNPAEYNGVKFCLSGARPVGVDGLGEIKAVASTVLDGHGPADAARGGSRREQDLLPAFVEHVISFVDPAAIRPMRVVADTANGMGGLVVPAVFERIPTVDGTFPNHPADPLQPANQRDLQARVRVAGFDVGLAFDGDADRVFVVDEHGAGLSGSTTTAILAAAVLRTTPGATVLHNLICSRAVPEVIREHGGVPVRTKVGHSFIKQVMADTGAIFGGEHSAHYYFARNYRADSGLIATMLVLGELSRSGQELSILRKPFERYSQSGEINTQVADVGTVLGAVRAEMAALPQDDLDGLTVDHGSWWFNLRPSNTEPLLRLNLEAATRDECDAHVAELLALITGA